jgi:hypothetical protein
VLAPLSTSRLLSGQIVKDDVNGFSSTSDISFVYFFMEVVSLTSVKEISRAKTLSIPRLPLRRG